MAFKHLVANGKSAAGAISLAGAVVGDRVLAVIGQTPAQTFVAPPDAGFESVITVADQIQQASSTDLSLKRFTFVLETPTAVAVAAAGSAQGDAAALTENAMNSVSAADGTKGVVLPAAVVGAKVKVYNEHATNGLKVYPATGDDINDGSANAAVTIEGKTLAIFEAIDSATWAAIYTANS